LREAAQPPSPRSQLPAHHKGTKLSEAPPNFALEYQCFVVSQPTNVPSHESLNLNSAGVPQANLGAGNKASQPGLNAHCCGVQHKSVPIIASRNSGLFESQVLHACLVAASLDHHELSDLRLHR
jgi:hypothetical protein